MPKFLVTYDDAAFTPDEEATDLEIDEEGLVKLNKELAAAGLFTDAVLAVVSARVSCDDGQEDGDYKVFTSVILRIQEDDEDEDAIDTFPAPDALLAKVLDHLNALHSAESLANELNWEVLDAELEAPVRATKSKKSAQSQ